jgi:hypothetical protein
MEWYLEKKNMCKSNIGEHNIKREREKGKVELQFLLVKDFYYTILK